MEKYIYKITNRINNKIYIGQSNNVKNRWNEHKRLGSLDSTKRKKYHNSKLYNAINKYGIENFVFEIIEGPISNYNEREKYWIQYYKSDINGYNITSGGEDPPILKGDNSPMSVYSEKDILLIQNDLIDNKKTYDEISQEYNISKEYLSIINLGNARYNEKLNYPLRKADNAVIEYDLFINIFCELNYTTKTIEQIGRDLNVSSKVVREINNGVHRYSINSINYPIRKDYELWSEYIKQNIIKDLKENKLKINQIALKYDTSRVSISRFNNGKIYKMNNTIYPIRTSKERVYN